MLPYVMLPASSIPAYDVLVVPAERTVAAEVPGGVEQAASIRFGLHAAFTVGHGSPTILEFADPMISPESNPIVSLQDSALIVVS